MRTRIIVAGLLLCLIFAGCGPTAAPSQTTTTEIPLTTVSIESIPETTAPVQPTVPTEAPTVPAEEPAEEALVEAEAYIPGILADLKYATEDNFTGQVIYEFTSPYLRYGTVKKLMLVQEELQTMGLGLKIWDGFRPVSAQFKLWEVCPDPTYVANPVVGYSSHSRGNTVDLTLVDAQGRELAMPTGFDDFSPLADRNYLDCGAEEAANARLLQEIMEKYGFSGYFGEWWHYSDTVIYPVEQCFDPGLISLWYADCNEFISLRKEPDASAEVLTRILVHEEFTLLGYDGDFAMVDFRGQRGYVLKDYIAPVA